MESEMKSGFYVSNKAKHFTSLNPLINILCCKYFISYFLGNDEQLKKQINLFTTHLTFSDLTTLFYYHENSLLQCGKAKDEKWP